MKKDLHVDIDLPEASVDRVPPDRFVGVASVRKSYFFSPEKKYMTLNQNELKEFKFLWPEAWIAARHGGRAPMDIINLVHSEIQRAKNANSDDTSAYQRAHGMVPAPKYVPKQQPPAAKPYTCSSCGAGFYSPDGLAKHKAVCKNAQ